MIMPEDYTRENIMKLKIKKNNLRKKLLFFTVVFVISSMGSVFASEAMEEQAVEYFKEALEAHKSGDIDLAITLYTKAIYTKSNYAQAHNNLGTAYAQKNDYVKAKEEYDRAVMIDSDYSIALKNLAIIYAERQDYEKFYEYWKRATGIGVYSPFLIDDEAEE